MRLHFCNAAFPLTAAIVSMSKTLVQYLQAFAFPYFVWHSSVEQRIVLSQRRSRRAERRQTLRAELGSQTHGETPGRGTARSLGRAGPRAGAARRLLEIKQGLVHAAGDAPTAPPGWELTPTAPLEPLHRRFPKREPARASGKYSCHPRALRWLCLKLHGGGGEPAGRRFGSDP